MLKVIAEFFVNEKEVEAATKLIKKAIEATIKEAGNIAYEAFVDKADTTHIVFVEEWKSQEALEMHMATAHFNQLIEGITKIQTKEPIVKIYSELL